MLSHTIHIYIYIYIYDATYWILNMLMSPKGTQELPQRPPGCSQEAPRSPKNRPRCSQEPPKTSPKSS